jgi:hypothetical protein
MLRSLIVVLSALVVALSALASTASAQLIDASERGLVCTGGSLCPAGGNNGATPGNLYLAGFDGTGQYRDWFEFAIPTLNSSLVSATLNLADVLHVGGSLTYDVYGLAAQPLAFSDVTTSNPFGSVVTSSASMGTLVSITLDSAALADIVAHQGGHIFIGGIDSGENSSTTAAGDFGVTNAPFVPASLSLNTIPEPASIVLLASLLVGSLVVLRRKTRRAE